MGSAPPDVGAAGGDSRRDAAQQSPPRPPAWAGLMPGPPRALVRAADGAARPAAGGGGGVGVGLLRSGAGGAGPRAQHHTFPGEELSPPGGEPCGGSRSPAGALSDVTQTQ